ncbi:predicted protein [Plenodomus lingam JN3]|uniref:Predicted protein n=1 Tax=Leptosphaeria maculans (strain JN3 / isolate v23.1.3 / race Av1-4-5-6-7-8) TaxID=985895 RepID=E5AEK3_LEPMJ|nr:predicted protein [Plenodomus lingam JN3]CBY01642.1 predicted protein [Plenodomus lingam JN3]
MEVLLPIVSLSRDIGVEISKLAQLVLEPIILGDLFIERIPVCLFDLLDLLGQLLHLCSFTSSESALRFAILCLPFRGRLIGGGLAPWLWSRWNGVELASRPPATYRGATFILRR